MGEHKYNPTAIAAKEGKLPPRAEVRQEIDMERGVYSITATVPREAREEKQEEPKEAWGQIARAFRSIIEAAVRWLT